MVARTERPRTLSEKIRGERLRAGMTLDELAEAARTSRQYLIQIEKGRSQPSDQMLGRIAGGLGCPIEAFLGSPTERLKEEQRERLATAFEPLLVTLVDELLSILQNNEGGLK